jgi:hypothetical protein
VRLAPIPLTLLLAVPAAAQEGGWHYSPFPGEGDRAALGCSAGSTPDSHTCVAVRCEDDFSVGLHIETTREGTDAGRWRLQVDAAVWEVTAAAIAGSPYGAKVEGDVVPFLDAAKNGGRAFVEPIDGADTSSRALPLEGSLYAINQALFFCAPTRKEPEATEPVMNPDLVAPVPSPQLTR